MLGTSTVTTYFESASGIAEGDETGLTVLTVAIMFAVALFFAPIFLNDSRSSNSPGTGTCRFVYAITYYKGRPERLYGIDSCIHRNYNDAAYL